MAADTAKLAALTQNAGATPNAATIAPPAGASAIWEMTAADHRPLLAAISSSSPTMAGSTDAEAGLKNTRSCRQPERDGIDRREMVINERQDRGQGGTPQVRGDHDANAGQPVHHGTGDRGEQHRHDLRDDRAADPSTRAGQPKHQHDHGDGVHRVTPPGDGLRSEQAPVTAAGQHRPQPGPSPSGHVIIVRPVYR